MKIAYLTNCFGTQSHTFIRREIRALRATGLNMLLYGIRRDTGNIAPDAADLVAETHYLYPLSAARVISCNLRLFLHAPIHYLRGLFSALKGQEFSIRRRLKMVYHYLASATFADHLIENGITHIHAHFLNVSASVAMYAAYHTRLPYSITVHSAGTFKTPDTLGVHQKLRNAQFLLMISAYNVDYFDAIQPCRAKSHVVRCGMDLDSFQYRPSDTWAPHQPARILAVGRFVEKKGFIHLIEAAAHLRERGCNFCLEMIGDGPLAAELKARCVQLKLTDVVQFSGQQSTDYVKQAMTECDIVVVPSVTSQTGEMEGLPVVIMEAMATGVPVVASAHSGIPEILQDGITGHLTPEKNPIAIARAIEILLSEPNPALIDNARRLIEQTFNIDVVAKQRFDYFTHYQAVA